MAQVQNGKNPAGKKFLFVSFEGLIGDVAWAVKKEGNEVKYFIDQKDQRDVCDGFVEKCDEWEKFADWADVIVFDDIGFGAVADKLRKGGKLVVGGSVYTDKLEDDRDFGQEEMKAAGINILPNWTFDNFDSAIKFVKENPGRYVLKPSGKAQNEKELLFVGQEEDGKDILQVLEHYKKNWAKKIKIFQLQKFAAGVEIAVGAFFNGKDFVFPINVNFEHKKLFPGEIGPSTGELGCYDEQTEVLTKSGWKFFRDLAYEDEICTLNPNGHVIEFHKPEKIVSYGHHKKLISIKNRAVDILVTPNHNMYVCSQQNFKMGRSKFEFVRADNLECQSVMPRTGTWVGAETSIFTLPSVEIGHYSRSAAGQVIYEKTKEIQIPMDNWLAFIGIYIADGSVSQGYKISIAQKVHEKVLLIRQLLSKLPFKFSENRSEFYCYNKQLFEFLKIFGKAPGKYVPQFIKELSPRQIEIFLKWFCLGDGHIDKKGFRIFYTCSKKLADDVQELLLKIGRVGLISSRTRSEKRFIVDHFTQSDRLQYEIIERIKKINSWIDRRDIKTADYDGRVYCAIVKNHVMYVRRNGKPYWCGNTSMFWSPPNEIFKRTLGKMKEKFAASGYVGYTDINCIANGNGIYPLEFTMRFGFPHISIAMEGVLSPWGEFLHAIASGQNYNLRTKKGFQVGVVIGVPPFPFKDADAFRKYSEGAHIIFKKPSLDGVHICDVKTENDDWILAGNSGYALIITGSGSTMDEARAQAYNRIKNIMIPNMFYRTDIGVRWHRDSDRLQTWGLLY